MATDINLNNAKCIVEKAHVGYSEFVNICSGQAKVVEWTELDWASAAFQAFLMALLVAILTGACLMGVAMWKELCE